MGSFNKKKQKKETKKRNKKKKQKKETKNKETKKGKGKEREGRGRKKKGAYITLGKISGRGRKGKKSKERGKGERKKEEVRDMTLLQNSRFPFYFPSPTFFFVFFEAISGICVFLSFFLPTLLPFLFVSLPGGFLGPIFGISCCLDCAFSTDS